MFRYYIDAPSRHHAAVTVRFFGCSSHPLCKATRKTRKNGAVVELVAEETRPEADAASSSGEGLASVLEKANPTGINRCFGLWRRSSPRSERDSYCCVCLFRLTLCIHWDSSECAARGKIRSSPPPAWLECCLCPCDVPYSGLQRWATEIPCKETGAGDSSGTFSRSANSSWNLSSPLLRRDWWT